MAKCNICGEAGVRTRRVTRSYRKGGELVVIENIPAHCCPHCGESYFTAETLHEIERLKRHHKSLAERQVVEVIAFA